MLWMENCPGPKGLFAITWSYNAAYRNYGPLKKQNSRDFQSRIYMFTFRKILVVQIIRFHLLWDLIGFLTEKIDRYAV